MSKQKKKTVKCISKRVWRTKNGKKAGKLMKRSCGQDHFNAREGGKTMRNKRQDKNIAKTIKKNINAVI
ncbi:MAG: hypothetical protein A2233_04385 [Candidatus Kerfeldbacteria bacterium RIFOXYA2_FULL_38_24]|uniref:50S ribosomal protein L35 n=1 Tax=Candidatus Kerfeldbacteria bacterium RIFOXYB2_FULL_38_14 TaxID=1798547 RepID=A0A1G2BDQ3_9BACT|nr:MAG: hypothetical protein A2233_04385 [Candidatus Kerfeldbacteria bacterium RIFOXYA2_FULL_38_24]OGY86337.1 MAG: hypothetical protein A2319_02985 [Candidatus Kerfeldbacteria bacterium RIFOXYB2_FULL_38_14]OGY88433.1 MAG: hypothetical protein A2458_02305 [Candidatus Kerfeldbacteria bacterium RIFOXYC2_FULL_38_9]